MKKLIPIVLFLIAFQSQSQVRIGLNIKPELSFANRDVCWFSASYGVASNINIYKRISINTGVGFQSKNYDTSVLPHNSNEIYPTGYLIRTIPVYVQPRIDFLRPEQKFQLYGIAGTILNFCFYERSTYPEGGLTTETNTDFGLYNVMLSVGIGAEYNLARFSFFIEPSFNTRVYCNRNYFHPYGNTVSASIGCMYKFGN